MTLGCTVDAFSSGPLELIISLGFFLVDHYCVVVVVVAGLNQPVPTANGPGLQEGPEILSHPFQGNWGLFFI